MKRILGFFLILAFVTILTAAEKAPLKVFISVDMEGIWGVVNSDQTSSDGKDFGLARRWMVDDVNAVAAGLFEAGAAEVVVNDSHGGMRNLVASDLDPRVSLVSGSPKPLSMMQGLDASFAACLLIGYHARAGSVSAVLDHTISGGTVRSVKVNGLELPELGINGAIAGYFKVPVVMLSGDTETCRQAKAILGPDVVTVAVKEGVGRFAAKLLPMAEARRKLQDGAREALIKRASVKPFVLSPPFQFELAFQNSAQAEMPSQMPLVTRVDARTVAFTAQDYLEGFRLLRALIILGQS
jgi:D-amino peptidase